MHEVEFPMTREPADAWPDFVGWRVNYESAAYWIAAAIDAVPAPWSGPRRQAIGRAVAPPTAASARASRRGHPSGAVRYMTRH